MILETAPTGLSAHLVVEGKSSSEAVVSMLANCIPKIIERIADDPMDAASHMMYINEKLEAQTNAYLAGHADEIAGAVRDFAKGLADK